MKYLKTWLTPVTYGMRADLALLILRIGSGLMMMTHGGFKISEFNRFAPDFYDFLGLGGEISLGLTVFAEFFCALLVAAGLMTRIVLVPLIVLTLVIVFDIHGSDPFGDKEVGLLYLMAYAALFLSGPGRFALDHWIWPADKK